MNLPEYMIEVTIRAPGQEPFHYGMKISSSPDVVPPELQRRYVEEHVYRIINAAIDKLFEPRP